MRALRPIVVPTLSAVIIAVSGGCESLNDPGPTYWIAIEAPGTTVPAPGGTVQLTAIMGDDRNRVLEDAVVTWSSTRADVATVDADGLVTGLSTGQAVIRATSGEVVGSIAVDVVQVGSCDLAGTLAVPDTVSGQLPDTPCTDTPPFCRHVWAVDVDAAGEVTVTEAAEAAAALFVGDGESWIEARDHGLGYVRDRFELAEGGATFVCVAGSLPAPYTLSVTAEPPPVRPCPSEQPISWNGTVEGSLTADDCEFAGYRIDSWRLESDTAFTPRLAVTGSGERPYMALQDTMGVVHLWLGLGPGSTLWLEPDAPLPAGVYDVTVGLPEASVAAPYTLELRPGPAVLTCGTAGTLHLGETATGTLGEDACPLAALPQRGLADGYDLTLADTTTVEFTMTSDAFLPTLVVTDTSGDVRLFTREVTEADHHDGTLPPGRYRAWIKAWAWEQGGPYDFSAAPAGVMPPCDPVGDLVVGGAVTSSLGAEDCHLQHDRYGETWRFAVQDSASVTATLHTDLRGYLVLTDTTGAVIDRDDRRTDRSSSAPVIDAVLGPGAYQLWAMSYWPRESGEYRLTLETGG